LDLEICPGEKLALVGKSGCGKTTIASLMIGLFTVKSGKILIDGQELSDCSLRSIRGNIGIVQQDVLLFDGTIRENLLLAKRDATDDELWQTCEKAGIADFLRETSHGLDTVIGKAGVGLSGGQKQRLAIARIYIKNSPIIIFDEATSALDHETELAVHSAWRSLLCGRTAIIIAHRQSSVMLCDRAVLIEDGRVAVSGTPDELAMNDEKVRELFAISNVEGGVGIA
jgi:ABC-type multidrug transport system fused ATPase/permease subunit